LVKEADDYVCLDRILGIGYDIQPGENGAPGKIGFGFLPHSPMTEKKKYFNMIHVVYLTSPSPMLESAYRQASSPIATPQRSLIVG
jgi:hypothetical protein